MNKAAGGALFAIACGLAQSPQSEISSNNQTATFQSRVKLVIVPVVVRDKNGNAVGDLKRDDFQILDRAKPQVISRFSIEKSAHQNRIPAADLTSPAANATSIPTRFTAFVFDDLHTEFGDLARARDAANKYIKDDFGAKDRAGIFTTSGLTMLDFTDDREKIHDALFKLRPRSRRQGPDDCPPMTYHLADLIGNKSDPTAISVSMVDAELCARLLNPRPDMLRSLVEGAAMRALAMGNIESQTTLSTLSDVVRRLAAAPGERSLILASAGFEITNDYRQDEADLMDHAIHANVFISAIEARGLYVIVPGGDASRRADVNPFNANAKMQYERDSAMAGEDFLGELADGTGGSYFHNNNDLLEGFRRVAARPEFMYILGFSPQDLKIDGNFHALKVRVKKAGYSVQFRRGYYAPRHLNDPVEQARQEISDAVFSRDELRDIPVEVQTQFFKAAPDDAKVAVLAQIDVRSLPFGRRTAVTMIRSRW